MKKTELKLEYLKRVIEMINNKGLNQDCYNFKYGDETPISSKVFKIMPNGIIILSEEVYYALLKVHELTITKIREIPFSYMVQKLLIIKFILMIFVSKLKNYLNVFLFIQNQCMMI